MPAIGNNQAALVVMRLLNDFRSIRFGLSVRIGGGVPGEEEDGIRLGDVVVSKPTATSGRVVQYEMEGHGGGHIAANGNIEATS